MVNIIYKDRFTDIAKRCFVVCDCGEEIIEIQRWEYDDERIPEYHISFHGWYNKRTQPFADFTFNSTIDFIKFVGALKSYAEAKADTLYAENIFHMQGHEDKSVLCVLTDTAKPYISICKFKNDKTSKATWEIIISKPEVVKLVDELLSWFKE